MKIPSVTMRIVGESVEILYSGLDKSEALRVAKMEADKPHNAITEYRVLQAIGSGIAWRRRATPAPPAPEPVEPEPVELESTDAADAKAVRDALKAKGVSVPPRISIDNLLKLAIDHGVEV